MEYEIVIGLEVHAQLSTKTKLFCGCTTPFGDPPNTHGCPVCLGLPGSLPVLNRAAVEMAVRAGLALGCEINNKSIFARKNYFYPDLTKNYQISQYELPVCGPGKLPIVVDGEEFTIGVTRVHLEEDAGKLIHDLDPDSLFDVNRSGSPLIEIVSEPDMRSPAQAHAYLAALKQILEYLGVCDCNMEEGSLRCDGNISLRPKGQQKFGTKTEIKNMNSFKNLEKALEYEARRQEEVLRSGGTVEQQTYLWNPSENRSIPMRSKEDAHDYRYFPDPDLLPLVVETDWVEGVKKSLPELPGVRRRRFEDKYGISAYAAEVLTGSRALADYFEQCVDKCADAKTASNWVMTDIMRMMNDGKIESPFELKTTPERLGRLIKLINDGGVSAKAAKKVLDMMESEGKEPEAVVKEQGLSQVSDASALEAVVKQVVDAHPDEVQRYRGGDKKLTSFFMGQIMKASKGAANPKEVSAILNRLLG
ncbi:MAG: Asp-tRNA(Asn)/Glu-tRNA(Gln) amidotransferase subunit GatB [Chitinispirillia bacterium]|nr:Asp-tRNA(Asn)/Glu-tRNA(Gln) amidotransferase subunit GatB [Chitinispirillia bacterium]MCL2268444.1 Asp-tRNA(Asn)/Glu-tRNA(Gln) amidotransferase subunit GatB [Chitinispirillia bacterium]